MGLTRKVKKRFHDNFQHKDCRKYCLAQKLLNGRSMLSAAAQNRQFMATIVEKPTAFGPYYLHELINSGGMSDIFLATNQEGKSYALRRLHDNLRFNFGSRRRFVKGCEILQKISGHELIIQYVEHGKIDGSLYLLMEYVEGDNLKQLYARADDVLVENIGNILIDMAKALEHVHTCGYMHLDFKPENVMVTRNGSLRLVDFDLTLPIPEKPQKSSKNPGTPFYMSPEQLLRNAFDHRVDIFAYGVTAYELLTYKKPFQGENPAEVLKKQMDPNSLVPPREHNPEIPVGLEKVILKCLESDMEKRYPYMSVLVRDLELALYV